MVERIRNKGAERSWRRGRLLGIIIAAVLLSSVLLFRFYNTVQAPNRVALEQAEQAAVERLQLQEITSVERFVGNRPYAVVFAKDLSGDEVVVWMWDGEHHIERQAAGLTREQVKEKALGEDPSMEILRISPGKLRNDYVWEVFYKRQEANGSERHFYDYYRFTDGLKLETFRLAN